ncbi:MAG: hypothetical protein R3E89_16940 [Thiolinea sp.]
MAQQGVQCRTAYCKPGAKRMYFDYLESPLGLIVIQASEQGVTRLEFTEDSTAAAQPNAHTTQCRQQLAEYFAGQRREFDGCWTHMARISSSVSGSNYCGFRSGRVCPTVILPRP